MADVSGGVNVTIDFSTLEELVKGYEDRGGKLKDKMPTVKNILVDAIEEEFETEGRGRWKKSQRAEDEGGKTLQDSGNMVTSVGSDSTYGDDFALAGTDVPYAEYHVSDEPRTIIPLRDFLDIDMDQAMDEIESLFLDELE